MAEEIDGDKEVSTSLDVACGLLLNLKNAKVKKKKATDLKRNFKIVGKKSLVFF